MQLLSHYWQWRHTKPQSNWWKYFIHPSPYPFPLSPSLQNAHTHTHTHKIIAKSVRFQLFTESSHASILLLWCWWLTINSFGFMFDFPFQHSRYVRVFKEAADANQISKRANRMNECSFSKYRVCSAKIREISRLIYKHQAMSYELHQQNWSIIITTYTPVGTEVHCGMLSSY